MFLDLGPRRGEVSASRPDRFLPQENPVPIVEEAVWAPGPVRTGVEILTPPGNF
jgi:hypothetical protein